MIAAYMKEKIFDDAIFGVRLWKSGISI